VALASLLRSIPSNRALRTPFVAPYSLAFVAILSLPFLLYAPFFSEPFDHDEGTYATIAQGVLNGELPYRDYFDHKPPLIYVWYALSFLGFGESVESPRIMVAGVWSATSVLVYYEGLVLGSRRLGLLASALFVLSSGFVKLQASANTEAFMLLPLMASLIAATKASQSRDPRWYLAIGVFGALATLTKQVAVVHLVLLVAFLVWSASRRGDARGALRGMLTVWVGASAAIGLSLLPFVIAGGLDEFFYANVTYNRIYSGQIPLPDRIEPELRRLVFFVAVAAPLAGSATIGLWSMLRRKGPQATALPAISLLACFIGAVFTGRAIPHYYVALLPAISLLGAMGINNWGAQRLPLTGVATFLIVLCLTVNGSIYLASTAESRHIARFGPNYATTEIIESAEVGRVIASLTAPDERFFNYGRESQLHFYADRLPATRLFYDRPFLLDPSTLGGGMADLRDAKPRLIVDTISLVGAEDWLDQHPAELREILANEYVYFGRVRFADFYMRK